MNLLTFLDLFTPHRSSSRAFFLLYELPFFVVSSAGFRTTQKISSDTALLFHPNPVIMINKLRRNQKQQLGNVPLSTHTQVRHPGTETKPEFYVRPNDSERTCISLLLLG